MAKAFVHQPTPLPDSNICIDNQSALSVSKNPEHHGRMKHLDLCFYWLRDVVADGYIAVHYIPTDTMPVDVMTKALSRVKMQEMCSMLGFVENIILTLYGLFYTKDTFYYLIDYLCLAYCPLF